MLRVLEDAAALGGEVAIIDGSWRYGESDSEIRYTADEILTGLAHEELGPPWDPGSDAWLMFSDRRHSGEPDIPDNYPRIGVNASTGFGGLIWFVSDDHPCSGGVFDGAAVR